MRFLVNDPRQASLSRNFRVTVSGISPPAIPGITDLVPSPKGPTFPTTSCRYAEKAVSPPRRHLGAVKSAGGLGQGLVTLNPSRCGGVGQCVDLVIPWNRGAFGVVAVEGMSECRFESCWPTTTSPSAGGCALLEGEGLEVVGEAADGLARIIRECSSRTMRA